MHPQDRAFGGSLGMRYDGLAMSVDLAADPGGVDGPRRPRLCEIGLDELHDVGRLSHEEQFAVVAAAVENELGLGS